MKRYLRVFSLFLVMVLLVTSNAFACAEESYTDSLTMDINNQLVDIKYRVENNNVTYVEVDNNVVTREGNDVFLNGIKIAEITTTTDATSNDVEPRTGIVYGGNTCPAGASPSDYDQLYRTKLHNITFEIEICKLTRDLLLSTLVLIVPFANKVTGREVFDTIAGVIISHASAFDDNCVYAVEYMYSGGIPYTYRNEFYFYIDKEKKNYLGTAFCYSAWA